MNLARFGCRDESGQVVLAGPVESVIVGFAIPVVSAELSGITEQVFQERKS